MKKINEELINQIIVLLNKPEGVNSMEKAGIIQQLQLLEETEKDDNRSD